MAISKITSAEYKRKGSNPGKSLIIKTLAAGNQERETELYNVPGIASGPTPDDIAVEVPSGTSGRIAVATQNYRLEVEVTAGQTKIYSTSADGETLEALIFLDETGKITIENDAQNLATVLSSLIDNVKSIITVGSPTTQAISSASQALLDIDKNNLLQILKE